MFKDGRYKKVLATTILLVLALSTVAIAANNIYDKKLTATHGRIKFKVDGKDVTSQIESKYGSPAFVVKEYGSRSYVPVRAIAELMGLEVKYDDGTHTAEIIDPKSKEYEEELDKKDKEIAELKKEIEKLKKNVVEEKDLKAIQKKINSKYGTYEDADFDIILKESKSRIDVTITMDLRDGRQESAWLRMRHNNKKDMIEDIVDIISSEFTNLDIYGSIYDEYLRKDVLSFNKRQNSSLSITYYDSGRGTYDGDIDDIVYDEFYKEGIRNVYVSNLDSNNYNIYLDIDIPYSYRGEWRDLRKEERLDILDRISDKIFYYYDYDYYYNYYDYDRVIIDVYVDEGYEGRYIRNYDEKYGTFD
ncbi:stalk domain-containing protein [Clostridium sp. Cult3]|uniref:stalk domain-containing protein n=1 Tax=Clostridium sp. Cult3 TaxID=2079004 RepID=UPI001F285CCA|nr:stalk domain-containing protein [Clostridium sp. Cult3]MCF6459521.1 hypothetical protein [Clostridium sp. Cult3]